MTNIKISELDELVNVADNDYLPIVDTSENETKKVAIQRIGAGGKSGDTLPIGSIVPYGNETAPANWLICDGSAISRTTYADLFAVIGTNFGSGDGSTTFNLPNMKGKVAVGLDSNDSDFNSIGKTGGGKTHTLTVEEIPSHTHLMEGVRKWVGSEIGNVKWPQDGEYQHAKEGMPTDYTGGNQSHNNLQPYQVQNYIIKAFQSAGVIGNVVKVKTNSDTETYSCNYVNDKFEKKYAIASITYQPSASSSYTVPLDEMITQNGGFTLENGSIVIPAGVSRISVSASVFLNDWDGTSNYLWTQIRKNGNVVSGSINSGTGSYLSGSVPSKIEVVNEGDKISLVADSPAGGTIRSGSYNTWLNIEVIE